MDTILVCSLLFPLSTSNQVVHFHTRARHIHRKAWKVMASENLAKPKRRSWDSFSTSRLSFLDDVTLHVGNAAALRVARTKLDRELTSAEEMVLRIRARRNALSTINCLPAEVLAVIFGFLAADEPPLSLERCKRPVTSPYARRGHMTQQSAGSAESRVSVAPTRMTRKCRVLGWMRVTHVCHLWRTVALAYPNLWGIDICSPPSWTKERLRRSKSTPIDVIVRKIGQPGVSKDILFLLLAHLNRTRTLHLGSEEMLGSDTSRHVLPCLSAALPILESLSCAVGPRGIMESPQDFTLPQDFLAPRLQTLRLRNVSLWWSCPLPESITELSLCVDLSSTRPSLGYDRPGLLALLSRLPHLRILGLKNTIPPGPSSSGSSVEEFVDSVPLRHLTQLEVGASDADCAWFLQQVSFPASVRLSISISDTSSLSNFGQIGRSLFGMVPTQFLSCSWLRLLFIEGWKAPEETDLQNPQYKFSDQTASWSVTIDKLGGFDLMDVIVDGLFGGVEHPDIKALQILGNLQSPQWWRLSASLCALEYVSLCHLGFSQFFQCLTAPRGQHPSGPAFLPHLRRIRFFDTVFRATPRSSGYSEMRDLIRALRKRILASMPIQELIFRTQDHIPGLILEIRAVVPKVSFYEVKPLPNETPPPRTAFGGRVSIDWFEQEGVSPGNVTAEQTAFSNLGPPDAFNNMALLMQEVNTPNNF
ncbi:hypothetical protein DENSPDRAFT_420358 [Dentipellis sp. KUC8613]|nr:hypothetical protein DENSPDRAFT_420358 [Dentipellis sp. KUC8613]